jgi:hypothetical protein
VGFITGGEYNDFKTEGTIKSLDFSSEEELVLLVKKDDESNLSQLHPGPNIEEFKLFLYFSSFSDNSTIKLNEPKEY